MVVDDRRVIVSLSLIFFSFIENWSIYHRWVRRTSTTVARRFVPYPAFIPSPLDLPIIRVTVTQRLRLLSKMMIWLSHLWMVSLTAHLDLPPPFAARFTRVWFTHFLIFFVSLASDLNIQNTLVSFHRKTMTPGQKSPMLCAPHPPPMMTRPVHSKIGSWLTPCLMLRIRCGLPQRDRIVRSIRRSSVFSRATWSRTGGAIWYYHASVHSISLIHHIRDIVRKARPTMSLKEYHWIAWKPAWAVSMVLLLKCRWLVAMKTFFVYLNQSFFFCIGLFDWGKGTCNWSSVDGTWRQSSYLHIRNHGWMTYKLFVLILHTSIGQVTAKLPSIRLRSIKWCSFLLLFVFFCYGNWGLWLQNIGDTNELGDIIGWL